MDFRRKSRKKTPPSTAAESLHNQTQPQDYLGLPLPPSHPPPHPPPPPPPHSSTKARSESPASRLGRSADSSSSIARKPSNGELATSDFAASIFNSAPFKQLGHGRQLSPSTSRTFFGRKRDDSSATADQGRSPRSSKSPSTSLRRQPTEEASGAGWHQIVEPVPEPDPRAVAATNQDPQLPGRLELSPPPQQLKEQSLSAVRHTSLPFNDGQISGLPTEHDPSTAVPQFEEARQPPQQAVETRQEDEFVQPSSTRSSALHPQMHPQPQFEAHLTSHGHEEQTIPIDTSFETDSAYDDGADMESATTSLRSAISDYIYENGRRYHAYRAGEYWGPNDEQMADQLDIGHHIHTMVLDGRLHLAPIGDHPLRCLDVGTGTGIWAIDFADQYPACQVIGTDLSPTQPSHVPPNLQFEVDDACSEWVYTKESFDFIHVRGMYGSVSDWPRFYGECMKHLKPGGYLEQVDTSVVPKSDDGTVRPDSVMAKWGQVSLEAGDAFGKTLRCVDENRQNFIDAGFEDVVEYRFKLPIGGWSKDKRLKEIGVYTRLYWEEGIEGWCLFLLTRYLGWKYEEVMVYVAQMRRMLRDRNVHAYHDGSVVYGRKPLRPLF